MKKLWLKIKDIINGLFWGLKITEENVLKPSGVGELSGTEINQQVHSNRLSTALLAGKETQQVRELRYRTYLIDREAKKYKYYSPYLAEKNDEIQDSKFVYYANDEGYDLVTIQANFPLVEGVLDGLKQVGGRGDRTEYWITIEREFGFMPRYRLEEYTKRIVVRRKKEESAVVDIYVTKYPDDKEFKSKGFVREIEGVRDNGIRSDVLDINTLSFATLHAYGVPDMLMYKFDKMFFRGISEYDGNYVISYDAHIMLDGIDLTNEFYCREMEEKYENHEKKEVEYDLLGEKEDIVYECAGCGKKVIYSTKAINDMEATDESVGTDNTEFFDMQIAEQTFGKKLCRDCVKKLTDEIYSSLEK